MRIGVLISTLAVGAFLAWMVSFSNNPRSVYGDAPRAVPAAVSAS